MTQSKKAGVVENVVAAIILMFIMVIGGLVYMGKFSSETVVNAGVKQHVYSDDLNINNLNNLLKVTEPVSGRSMGVLLADSVYYRNETLEFNNQVINVTNMTYELLNMAFNSKDFYMEVKPRIIEVSLNFVIDGSPSLEQEREKLATNLNDIIKSIEKKLNETNMGYQYKVSQTPVIANIYLLGNKPEKCGLFDNLTDPGNKIQCQVLSGSELYLDNTSINSSNVFLNNTRYNLDAFLNFYNMTPPFGFSWLAANGSYGASEGDYADSDWGYGMGYASNFDKKTSLSRLTIVFPMSDELSTSSFPDKCFYEHDWPNFVTCTLCDNTCPVDRSMRSVAKGLQIVRDNSHVINPVFSYSCDYVYDPDYNVAYEYVTHTATTNACGEAGCDGCTLQGSSVCFQPGCRDSIISQMESIANQTGGRVIDLADIIHMDINITDTIKHNIDQYALKIGVQNLTRERDVVETAQPLPNSQLVDVKLWVYRN